MKKFMQRSAYALTALATVFSVGAATVLAQAPAGNGFRISPVRSEHTIEKGRSDTLTITVENPSDATVLARGIANDFVATNDESGQPRLLLDEGSQSPKNSFKTLVSGLPELTLGAREKKDISVTISIPEDANAGGYYGAIRFEPQLAGGTGSTNVGLTASVGTIILVRVPDDLTERLDLVQFSAANKTTDKEGKTDYKPKSFFTSGDVSIMARLKNSGDIHVKPYGKVQVKSMFGKTHEYEFNNTDPRSNILPESTRKFGDDIPNMKWFGRYTVTAYLGYSTGGGGPIEAKATFWYIPTPILLLMIAFVIAVVAGVYWIIRKQKARNQHKHDVNKKKN